MIYRDSRKQISYSFCRGRVLSHTNFMPCRQLKSSSQKPFFLSRRMWPYNVKVALLGRCQYSSLSKKRWLNESNFAGNSYNAVIKNLNFRYTIDSVDYESFQPIERARYFSEN